MAQAADVWVVSPRPVERVSLLPSEGEKLVRVSAGALPSRAANNLIWLGRYAERCETTVRILRAYSARLAESSNPNQAILKDTRAYLTGLRHRRIGSPAPGLLARQSTARCTAPARSATASRPMAGWR